MPTTYPTKYTVKMCVLCNVYNARNAIYSRITHKHNNNEKNDM